MMLLLAAPAATSGDPNMTFQVILGLNALATAYLTFSKLFGKGEQRTITNPELTVEMKQQFVEKESFNKLESDLKAEIDGLETELRTDLGKLGIQLNGVSREVSEINGRSEVNTQRLTNLDTKMDRLHERLFTNVAKN